MMLLLLFLSLVVAVDGAVKVPGIIGDNMVLQTNSHYGARAFIFGTSDPNEIVIVKTLHLRYANTYNVTADGNGDWIVMLNPEQPGLQVQSVTVQGETGPTIVANNVSFGDVYLCAGESDMAFPLSLSFNASEEIATAANHNNFFIFKTEPQTSSTPQTTAGGHWEQLTTENVANFSAVCYLSVRDIANIFSTTTPVGLIQSTFVSARIEAWMSPNALDNCKHHQNPQQSFTGPSPSSVWNAMVYPFRFFTLRSVLWYQGVTDALAGTAQEAYRCNFQSMIEDWRVAFGYGDFSFVFVQLPPTVNSSQSSHDEDGVSSVRLAQLDTIPHPDSTTDTTGMAVTLDLGGTSSWGTANPPNKPAIAHRVAVSALHVAFAFQQQWNGTLRFASPSIQSAEQVSSTQVSVLFEPWTADGLSFQGASECTSCCKYTQGFEVLQNNGTWLSVEAKVDGSNITLEVFGSVKQVRYGFSNYVECVIGNKDGFVSSPFRVNVTNQKSVPFPQPIRGSPIKSPPMGFNSWNFYHCNINENIVRQVATAMVNNGMKDAGYQFVNIDDCWQVARENNGSIVPDPVRFPSGMATLTQQVHDIGMKFGLYTARGTGTCQMRPGSLNHEVIDASTYCYDWGIDYIKIDVCHGAGNPQTSWTKFHDTFMKCFNETNNYVVMSVESCSDATGGCGEWVASLANLWRTHGDIQATFSSVISNAKANNKMASVAIPGHFNDADMLQVGNAGLSFIEQKTHFALWCIMASPLLAGTDLIHASNETLQILTAMELIGVNQDLGKDNKIQGVLIQDSTSANRISIWKKVMSTGDIAVFVINEGATETSATIKWETVGISPSQSMKLRDLWLRSDLGVYTSSFTHQIASHDILPLMFASPT
eukprot:m.168641 g.168641  ORF g.168641 m.168641 type:complete len:877 (+) comp13466_c5_seq1:51-2681(+)